MPAVSSIIINDGATTPVAHTFSPTKVEGPLATYHDRAGGVSIGYPALSIQAVQPSKSQRLYKTTLKVVMPVLENVTGTSSSGFTPAPTKAYDMVAIVHVLAPERSTTQNRKDILAFVKNALAHATLTSVVQDNEVIY